MFTTLVCGTPGTGKSHCSQILSDSCLKDGGRVHCINLGDFIVSRKLYSGKSIKYDSLVFEPKRVKKELDKYIGTCGPCDFLFIESHTVECIPKKLPNLIIVLRARTEVLYDRLEERGYSPVKIQENIDCEVMNVIEEMVRERFTSPLITVLDSNSKADMDVVHGNFLNAVNS
jgi:adenylate kinase